MKSTLILDRNDVNQLLGISDVLRVVEDAFRQWGEGKGSMPPKAYLTVENGDFRAMPAALPGSAGMKWVNAHPGNRKKGDLPSVMAVIIYNDPETGYPLAIMDATEITAYRTGSAAAIASMYLARSGSRTLGIIGAGYQAFTQILAHAEVWDLESVSVYDVAPESIEKLKSYLPDVAIKSVPIEEAVASDILCTLTPSRAPVVKREWVQPGVHINAVGADAAGKQELDPQILKDSRVFVDDIRQAGSGGEINVPVRNGTYTLGEVAGTLAELVTGNKQGRDSDGDITVFDSTGIAIEDIAVARLIYEKAIEKGGYRSVDLVGV